MVERKWSLCISGVAEHRAKRPVSTYQGFFISFQMSFSLGAFFNTHNVSNNLKALLEPLHLRGYIAFKEIILNGKEVSLVTVTAAGKCCLDYLSLN